MSSDNESFAALQESRDLLRVTLASISDGVITTDALGRVNYLNPTAELLTGWTLAQAVGLPLEQIFRIVNQETRAAVENPVLRCLREAAVVGLANHTLLITRDGTERTIDDSAAPIRNAKGEIAGAVLVFRDITERNRAEMAAAQLAAIVAASEDAIISKDLNGTIVTWNRGAEKLFGFTASEAIGMPVTILVPADHLDEEPDILERIRRGEAVEHYETVRQRKDGSRVDISLAISPIRNARGQVIGASTIARDITVRVKLLQQVAAQSAAIASESRRKDEFLAMLSHELRNPLAPIRSAVHLLKLQERDSESPLQRQAHDIIERQTGNLTKLVSDLLEVSRVISGRIRLNQQIVDLNRALRHAVETVMPVVEERKHSLTILVGETPVWSNADPTRLEEILVNLLTNAAKYTPDGGQIIAACEPCPERNEAVLRVRDNGLGIEKELQVRIFDLFAQADRSLDRAQGGLGIGLSLVQRLVQLHGGTVEVDSPPQGCDRGSEFLVRLPTSEAPDFVEAALPAEMAEPAGMRVLVVDDNIDLVLILASTLRFKGYTVQTAYTGPDAIQVAQHWHPHAIILDIGLPGLDGYQVARQLRAHAGTRHARLIALTGYGREADIDLAHEAGFDAHLVKPYELGELEKLLTASVVSR